MSEQNTTPEAEGGVLVPYDPKASAIAPKTDRKDAHGGAQQKPRLTLRSSANSLSDANQAPRSAVPLYTSSIWSPSHSTFAANSTNIPQSQWDAVVHTPARSGHEPATPSPHDPSPLAGLGITSGQLIFTRSGDGRITGVNTDTGTSTGSLVRTEQHHRLSGNGSFPSPNAQSFGSGGDTLMKNPFVVQGQPSESFAGAISHSRQSQPASTSTLPNASSSTAKGQMGTNCDFQKPDSTGSGAVGGHYTSRNAELAGMKAEVWAERSHPHSLRRALKDPNANWEEAFHGALTILAALNPENFQMPLGTLVVSMKSEFPGNMIKSVREGRYSVMANVAERIQQFWEARYHPGEKVLMLFSITGSKKFCGLAEMSGPWKRDLRIDGWEENPNAKDKCAGSIPITWIYIKNVSYMHFAHIRHVHNGNPAINMWNGMDYEYEIGRAMVEQYVRTGATASILGHPKNYAENYRIEKDAALAEQRRVSSAQRGSQHGRGGSVRGGLSFNAPFRGKPNAAVDNSDKGDATPTPPEQFGRLAGHGSAPPKFNVPVLGSTQLAPGEILPVTVDHRGNLVVLPSPTTDGFGTNRASLAPRPLNTARDLGEVAGGRRGGLQHSTSMNSIRGHGRPALHPAASMDSLTQHRGSNPLASGFASPGAHNASFGHIPGRARGPGFPATARPGSARASRKTPATSAGQLRGVPDTPTHRPHSHLQRGHNLPPIITGVETVSSDEQQNLEELKASFYTLHAEKNDIERRMQSPLATSLDTRLLHAKLERVGLQMKEVHDIIQSVGGRISPERMDSSSEQGSLSSGRPNVSPLRAADGRPLYSASMLGSPLSTAYGDHGSEDRGFGLGHGSSASWDLREKAVRDLVDSPDPQPSIPASTALSHRASNFFADGHGDGKGNRSRPAAPTRGSKKRQA